MQLAEVNSGIIDKTFPALLPASMLSRAARVMLLAIGLQESRFEHRKQIGGPARGFWQFESGGGVKGVLTHPASAKRAEEVCKARGISADQRTVYETLADDDLLACAFARLLLLTDPRALPKVGDAEAAWAYYVRNWRPGKPHRKTWDALYAQAVAAS